MILVYFRTTFLIIVFFSSTESQYLFVVLVEIFQLHYNLFVHFVQEINETSGISDFESDDDDDNLEEQQNIFDIFV